MNCVGVCVALSTLTTVDHLCFLYTCLQAGVSVPCASFFSEFPVLPYTSLFCGLLHVGVCMSKFFLKKAFLLSFVPSFCNFFILYSCFSFSSFVSFTPICFYIALHLPVFSYVGESKHTLTYFYHII